MKFRSLVWCFVPVAVALSCTEEITAPSKQSAALSPLRTAIVAGITPQLAAGGGHTCALRTDGKVFCWGGINSPPSTLGPVVQVTAGLYHVCALQTDGAVLCWGDFSYGQTAVPSTLGPVAQVTAGGFHTCALKTDETVVCWGGYYGGPAQNIPRPLGSVSQLAAGGLHECALKSDGTAICWGDNSAGQTAVPSTLGPVTQITAGMYHTCALKADGMVVCWGDNSYGATAVPGTLGPVSQVSAGGYHTCALKTDETVVCWGDNSAGATAVPGTLGPVIQVSAGYLHTCALKADGTIACWDRARGNGSGESAVPFGLDLTPAAPDATAPVITYSTSPVPNAAGWNNASVSVIWGVNDPESGISLSRGCDPIIFATEGAGITQSCSASNGAGLSNSVSVTVNVDLTAPTIAVPANFTVNATAPSGALVTYNAGGTDALSGVASTTCVASSGSNFPIGVSSITCTATDRAGNNSTAGTFAVTVLGAPEQIANLIEYIKGTAIPTANKTTLVAFLQKALAAPRGTTATCGSLNLLVTAVTAARASVIPADKASHIIADATRIRDVIGCS